MFNQINSLLASGATITSQIPTSEGPVRYTIDAGKAQGLRIALVKSALSDFEIFEANVSVSKSSQAKLTLVQTGPMTYDLFGSKTAASRSK